MRQQNPGDCDNTVTATSSPFSGLIVTHTPRRGRLTVPLPLSTVIKRDTNNPILTRHSSMPPPAALAYRACSRLLRIRGGPAAGIRCSGLGLATGEGGSPG